MRRIRVIPVFLIEDGELIKTIKFRKKIYVGDPINALRIFNEKEVDELVFLDISASKKGVGPDFKMIKKLADEAFMPMCYGGGINNIDQIREIFFSGIEKVSLSTSVFDNPNLVRLAANRFGSQSIVVTIDVNKDLFGRYRIYRNNGQKKTGYTPWKFVKDLQDLGAGEIIVNSIDRDGTSQGYDLELITKVSREVDIPVVALGGASGLGDFNNAVEAGASAVAAGSLFVFNGPHRAVLISYPAQSDLRKLLYDKYD